MVGSAAVVQIGEERRFEIANFSWRQRREQRVEEIIGQFEQPIPLVLFDFAASSVVRADAVYAAQLASRVSVSNEKPFRRITSAIGGSAAGTTKGETSALIGARVGQRSLSITADTYTHVLRDDRELDHAEIVHQLSMATRTRRGDARAAKCHDYRDASFAG